MRKSASEIINDLETRVANLEKEAIFGLFKPKTLKEQNEARLRKEQKQQRSEEAALNKLKAQALKARTKAVSKVNEKFLKSVQYEIYKSPSVDNVDVSLNRGRMVGVISVGGFEYEIESSLGKVSFMMPDEYVMRKDLNNFRVTEGKFIISGLGLRSDAVITYNISDYADDVSYVVREILKVLVKASNVAHSDKAVSDRAERKRMRKEKYRLATSRKTALEDLKLDSRTLHEVEEAIAYSFQYEEEYNGIEVGDVNVYNPVDMYVQRDTTFIEVNCDTHYTDDEGDEHRDEQSWTIEVEGDMRDRSKRDRMEAIILALEEGNISRS